MVILDIFHLIDENIFAALGENIKLSTQQINERLSFKKFRKILFLSHNFGLLKELRFSAVAQFYGGKVFVQSGYKIPVSTLGILNNEQYIVYVLWSVLIVYDLYVLLSVLIVYDFLTPRPPPIFI